MNLNEREQKRVNSPVSAMIGVNKPEKAEKEKKQKKDIINKIINNKSRTV